MVCTKTESAYQTRNQSTQFESAKACVLIPSLARAKSARMSTRVSMNSCGLGNPNRFGIYN